MIADVDNGDQMGMQKARWPRHSQGPMGIEFRNPSQFPINSDCENLRELIDTKRANRHCEELEDTTGVFPLLLVDVLQR